MRVRMRFGALLCLGLALTFGITAPAQAASACSVAEAWAVEHAAELPRDYDSFVALPLSHRKAVYSRLAAEERQSLWHTQWDAALSREDLTDDQRAVILEAVQVMTPDTFALLERKRGWRYQQALEQVQALQARALEAFGKKGAGELFAQIGPVRSQRVVLVDHLVQAPTSTVESATAEACSCSQDEDFCPDGYGCGTDGDGCNVIKDDCGWFWADDCDGECLSGGIQQN